MKKPLAILVLLVIIAGLFFLLRSKNPVAPQPNIGQNGFISGAISNVPAAPGKIQSAPSPAVTPDVTSPIVNVQTALASRAASPNPATDVVAGTNEPPALPPLTVLDKARVMIHNYHAAFGENPVGDNLEIAAALQGKNPKQINFFTESGLRLNGKGEIVDGYGTPFFFHQISGQEMEIRSAGPDRVMWTSDDLVTR